MHSLHRYRILLLSLFLAMAVLMVACQIQDTEPAEPPQATEAELAEIIAKSRARSEAVESYASLTSTYGLLDIHEPSSARASRVDRVTSAIILIPKESHRIEGIPYYYRGPTIVTPEQTYVSVNTESSRWTHSNWGSSYGSRDGAADFMDLMFPEQFFNLQLAESDGDHYVIEGFGIFKEEAEIDSPYANNDTELPITAKRVQLKIRKPDHALVELTWWELPIAEVDENNEISIMRLPSGLEHLREVYQFSQIDEGISVKVPQIPELLSGLHSFSPQDESKYVSLRSKIAIELHDSFELVDIQLEPAVSLGVDEPQFTQDERILFKPTRSFQPGTTYTVTITWRDGEGGLGTHTWSFTTQHLS